MHLQIVEADRQLTRRYVANGPHCWAMWIAPQCGRNLTKPPHVKSPTIRAWGRYHSRIFDRWAANTGRLEGASAEEAVPLPVAVHDDFGRIRALHPHTAE